MLTEGADGGGEDGRDADAGGGAVEDGAVEGGADGCGAGERAGAERACVLPVSTIRSSVMWAQTCQSVAKRREAGE